MELGLAELECWRSLQYHRWSPPPTRHLELQQVGGTGKLRSRDVALGVFGHAFSITMEVKIEHN